MLGLGQVCHSAHVEVMWRSEGSLFVGLKIEYKSSSLFSMGLYLMRHPAGTFFFFFKQDLSLNLEFTGYTGDQKTLGVILSLPPPSWGYKHALQCSVLTCVLRIKVGSSDLHGKHFTY